MSPSEGSYPTVLLGIFLANYTRECWKGVWNSIYHSDNHLYIHNMNCYIWSRVCNRACETQPQPSPNIEIPTSKSVLTSYMCRSKGTASNNSVGTHNAPSFIQRHCDYNCFSVPVFYRIYGMASSSLVVSAASKLSTPLRFFSWASFYLGIWLSFDKITKWRVELAGPSLDAWQDILLLRWALYLRSLQE